MTRCCLSVSLLLFVGRGDDDGGEAVDVTAACDRLEELANAILGAAGANSGEDDIDPEPALRA